MRQTQSPGIAFPDHIHKENIRRRKTSGYENDLKKVSPRLFFLVIFLVFVLGILSIRLFYLQIVQGSYYRLLSDSNRTKTTIIHAPRGVIFDRNGLPLVFNVPGFREVINKKPVFISKDQALALIATGAANLEVDNLRQYPYAESTAHVLGYVGEITENDLKQKTFADYNQTDVIGKAGIEKQYQEKLRGVDGKKLVEVDAMGNSVRILGQNDPIAGENITLTLDTKLQKAAYEALKDTKKGVIIASTPQGEILALISKPSFDPNLFTLGNHYSVAPDAAYIKVSDILLDTANEPLLNRAISGVYPPGSTFKLITAAAGLESKKIDKNYTVEDTGVLKVGQFSFANWFYTNYGKTEGQVDVVKAIKRSNDIFFYKLADKIGVDTLSLMAEKFGLGKTLGIDLEGEAAGLVPTQEWKKKVIKEPWYLGDNYHYGIGQGYLLTTPLQVNMLTNVLANNAVLYKPYLLKETKAKVLRDRFLSDKTLSLIHQGMRESCLTGGVAWPLFEFKVKNPKLVIDGQNILEAKISKVSALASKSATLKDYRQVTIACKTGTAQHGDEDTLPHAWITLFAPAQNPQIVVTVLAESSGEGSSVAAPIAKKVLEEWFSR